LSPEYGDWNTVYKRFADWAEKGIWYKMFYYFANNSDMEYIMIDSTILRAHACSSGALKKRQSGVSGIRKIKRRINHKDTWRMRCSW
jgi:transposase